MTHALEARINTLKGRMVLRLPFIASIFLSMDVHIEKCGTAMTNGRWVKFDPDFWADKSDDQLIFGCAHETLHKALLHPWRRRGRNPGKWNAACDFVINYELSEMGMELQGTLLDKKFKGMSAEEVYEKLPDDKYDNMQLDLQDADASEYSEDEARTEIIAAAKAARMAGLGSPVIDRIIEGSKPRHPWRELLRRFYTANQPADYSWMRPNRRHVDSGLYLPSLHSESLDEVIYGIDTSGSIMTRELSAFAGEGRELHRDCRPRKTRVMYCDDRVHRVDTFERHDEVEFRPVGGGGTDFRPFFTHIAAQGWRPSCLIVFTDLYGSAPAMAPPYPVMWAVVGNHPPMKWGETIRVFADEHALAL